MAVPEPRRGPTFLGTALALVGFCILIGLGVWQVQRLKWKETLLAHIAVLKTAPPRPVEAVLGSGDIDFVRVSLDCPDLAGRPRLRLYGVQNGQIGTRLMTACPLAGGGASSVLVDLGFEPDAPCAPTRPGMQHAGALVGVLRKPDPRTFVTPANQPAQNQWYWRDLPAMAKALGAGPPAPAFVALEQGPPLPGVGCQPIRAPIPMDLPNNHLQYAITWFGLAAALAGVYLARLFRRRHD